MRSDAEPWWRQAEADLEAAGAMLVSGRYFAASWFSRQAVGKAVKALYLDRHGILAARTHDLVFLGATLAVPLKVTHDLSLLNSTFDLVRYPDSATGMAPVDYITGAMATPHVEAAQRVLGWVRGELT